MAPCAMPLPVAAALPKAFDAGVSWVKMPRGRCWFHGRDGPLQAVLNAIAAGRLQPMGACARVDGIAPWLRLSRVLRRTEIFRVDTTLDSEQARALPASIFDAPWAPALEAANVM